MFEFSAEFSACCSFWWSVKCFLQCFWKLLDRQYDLYSHGEWCTQNGHERTQLILPFSCSKDFINNDISETNFKLKCVNKFVILLNNSSFSFSSFILVDCSFFHVSPSVQIRWILLGKCNKKLLWPGFNLNIKSVFSFKIPKSFSFDVPFKLILFSLVYFSMFSISSEFKFNNAVLVSYPAETIIASNLPGNFSPMIFSTFFYHWALWHS